jgi:hypothetical protein
LPSARTSAGNKYKYKYKVDKKQVAAQTQLAVDRREAVQVKANSGGALRHAVERMPVAWQVSTLSHETFFRRHLDG